MPYSIRPLVTEDRRKRRLSGRDQISTAGRHLIDGIPFGRPRLRAPRDRPPIEIPSLKRSRSEYEQDDEGEESDEDERQLLITERGEAKRQRRGNVRFSEEFLNADQDDEDDADFDGEDGVEEEDLDSEIEEEVEEDGIAEALQEVEELEEDEEEGEDVGKNEGISEEDDDDDGISDVDESELEDELQGLLEDNKEVGDDVPEYSSDAEVLDQKENSLTNDEKIIALSTAFPRLSIADCTEALHQQGMDLAKAYLAVREQHLPTSGMDAVFKHCKSLEGQRTLDLDVLDKITALQAAFKGLDISVIQDVLTKHRDGLIASYNKLREYWTPRKELRNMLAHYQSLRMPTVRADQPLDQEMDAVQDGEEDEADDDGAAGDSGAESAESVVKHYDEHGFPSGSILDGTASRHMAEEMRKAGKVVALPVHIKFGESDDESIGSTDDFYFEDKADPGHVESSEDDAGHSEHDSKSNCGDNSSDDSGPEVASSKQAPEYPRLPDSASSEVAYSSDSDKESDDNDRSNSESDNDKVSDDGSDGGMAFDNDHQNHDDSDRDSDGANEESNDESSDEDIEEAEKENANTFSRSSVNSDSDDSSASSAEDSDSDGEASSDNDSSSDDDSSSGDSSSDDSSPNDQESVSEDVTGTRMEKNSATSVPSTTKNVDLTFSKSAPVPETRPVPPGQGKRATQKRNARRKKAKQAAARGQSVVEPEPLKESTSHDAPKTDDAADITEFIAVKKATILQRLNGIPGLLAQGLEGSAENGQESVSGSASASKDKPHGMDVDSLSSTSSQRQTKLDVEAGRRIVFGALGAKKPNTKAEEDSIRSTLTSDVRPLDSENPVQEQDIQPKDVPEEDPDAWRKKINYRAVECCHEGVELSEPPFPFVQRWDPQQQYYHKDNKRGGRSKRKQRNQTDFQDDSRSSAKRRKHDTDNGEDDGEDKSRFYDESMDYGNSTLNYDDSTAYRETRLNYDDEPQQAEDDDREYEDQEYEEDLPPLPEDLSSLPSLEAGRAMAGMILTWKQLLMSKATNWQPQVTNLTAIIVNIEGDGTFRVRLAKRDQNLDQNEKVYDEDGNRVYDKFEMVDLDEENDEEAEQGYRTVELAEMIEPRVLKYSDDVVPDTPSAPQSQDAPPSVEEDADKRISVHTSATLGRSEGKQLDNPSQMEMETQPVSESVIPESALRTSNEQRLSQTDPVPVEDISMTEERRSEISQLINEAGFRKEVDPSIAITEVADSDGSSNSPSRQLEDMSHDVLPAFESSQAQNQPEIRSSQVTTNSVDSQPILLEPFNGFSDGVAPPSEGRVEFPKLLVPTSDAGSVHSGRQPDPDFSIDLGNSSFNNFESRSPALQNASEAEDQATPRASQPQRARSMSESSNDSFPSLSALPTRSSTNRNTSTPSKSNAISGLSARKSDAANNDGVYEEAMKRLNEDESEESDGGLFVEQDEDYENSGSGFDEDNEADDDDNDSEDDADKLPSKLPQKLVQKPIEKPSPKKSLSKGIVAKRNSTPFIKAEASSYPQKSSRESIVSSSQFRIPEGSQVVSLLSSSPEPEAVENYAEDDIDETYKDSGADEEEEEEEEEESSLPRGSGWVKKNKKSKRVGTRGMSVPASSLGPAREKESVPKRFASSQATGKMGRSGGGESSQKAYAGSMKARNKLAANRLGRF